MLANSISILLCLIPWVAYAQQSAADDPVVMLSHGGRVRGQIEKVTVRTQTYNVKRFVGIPFAKPPVGERRFAPPEEHGGWSGIWNATELPNSCWQYIVGGFDLANPGARMWVNNTKMSEDCLYLNVWVPPTSTTTKLPVMVWIYGGGYTTGTSTLEVYDGAILAATQAVIIVSMQYRLGALGFIRLEPKPGTSLSNIALGNQGLLDQLLALKWVSREITAFGGNPESVTLFGESSGAVSVSALWASPLAHPYFHRVIIQSGSILTRWGLHELDQAHHRSAVFTKACGCPSPTEDRDASVKCLQGLDAMTLVDRLDSITTDIGITRNQTLWNNIWSSEQVEFGGKPFPGWATSSNRYFDVPFAAVVDGTLFPSHPRELLQTPSLMKQAPEMLIGVNQDEAVYFLLYGLAIEETQFLYDNGTVSLPHSIELAGLRKPLDNNNQLADFHWITAIQVLDEYLLFPGLSQIPAIFYNLPMKVNSSEVYADPNQIKLTGEQVMQRLNNLAADADFVCPTLEFADLVARLPKSTVYVYLFQQPTESLPWPNWTGVMHGYEIHYEFGMPHSKKFQEEYFNFTDTERDFSDKMMKMWAEFAKTGNPNGAGMKGPWPVYKPSSQKAPGENDHYVLDVNMHPASGLKENECAFWLHDLKNLARFLQKPSKAAERSVRYLPLIAAITYTVFQEVFSN